MGKKVLLINPGSSIRLYSNSKILIPTSPSLTLGTLAAPLIENNHEVEALDLVLYDDYKGEVLSKIKKFQPDIIGLTFMTPAYSEAKEIIETIKNYDQSLTCIGGGPHATFDPKETLSKMGFDITVYGEGDYVLPEILASKSLNGIKGICFRKGGKEGGKIVTTPPRPLLPDLDKLPFPDWSLFDISKYHSPKSLTRRSKVGLYETSRGCPFGCVYCNKNIFGRTFRAKSPKRVVDEVEYMHNAGFEEFHPQDDGFTTDLGRAKKICDLMVERGIIYPWIFGNGIRVDRVDKELLLKAKKAGCYRVAYGVESGNQEIINNIKKGITVDQVRQAVKIAKEAKMEVATYFMIGLPGETKENIEESIRLAVELDTDYSRTSILVPYPSTEIWETWKREGIIKNTNWEHFDFHKVSNIYEHPNLSPEELQFYYDKFYKKFYLRPSYMVKRAVHAIRHGHVREDIQYFLRSYILP